MVLSTKKMQVFINKTRSILNLHVFFFSGDVTIYMYSTPPMSLFVTNFVIWGTLLYPYPGDVIFEWPLG